MGKSTKTYEERIQEKDLRIEKLAQELKRLRWSRCWEDVLS